MMIFAWPIGSQVEEIVSKHGAVSKKSDDLCWTDDEGGRGWDLGSRDLFRSASSQHLWAGEVGARPGW